MVKIVKVSERWTEEQINKLLNEMKELEIEGIVVKDDELEVFDGDLEKIDIESDAQFIEERFSMEGGLEVIDG